MWYYLRSNIKKLNKKLKSDKEIINSLNSFLENTDQRTGSLMLDLKKLQEVDGMETWRQKEAQELSDLVQRRLRYLQNPKDCSKTNKLVCDIDKNCGFGCQIHHAVYCFIVAYGTQRTLILRSKNWRYSREGWEAMFQPISVNCTDEYGVSRANWSESNDAQVIYLPILDEVHPRPPYLPPVIPKDLSDRFMRLHSNPIVWWIGQFLKYLLRPQESLSKFLKEAEKKVDFNLPVVGIHVRRTDKLWSEGAFHKVEEYMEHVKTYYKQLELKQPIEKRQVYIATDDPNLLEECWNKFPGYTFIGEPDTAKVAAVIDTRYSPEALKGVVEDIYMLSKTDLLICTFSSQLGRLAYEIMQTNHPDASSNFRSLDDIFYFGGQDYPYQTVIYDHQPRSSEEIELKKGDVLIPRTNLWNGFSIGMLRHNNKSGVYPSYKVVDQIQVQEFPLYKEADDVNS
ncbi:alpha-(1,6)-fucosyltransferase-like [Limulus polyphemus]|uniref:Alpha-(1,6)-fucosyltransferase-like n=1 Tax=Limulus polyphemus TaxID=6850 RepID=A0ABM1SQU3_LIMPO|nr:alpha-(1,6)-fucosyltransferase-like [Limulus polyphemus]XP_022245999.1 alpha-(1,6)-fucosyltransferase-like [Limulus polyphemus]